MDKISYQVVKGKRKMYVYGEFKTRQEALDDLIRRQRDYGQRGLRIVKLKPYSVGMRQIVELK